MKKFKAGDWALIKGLEEEVLILSEVDYGGDIQYWRDGRVRCGNSEQLLRMHQAGDTCWAKNFEDKEWSEMSYTFVSDSSDFGSRESHTILVVDENGDEDNFDQVIFVDPHQKENHNLNDVAEMLGEAIEKLKEIMEE